MKRTKTDNSVIILVVSLGLLAKRRCCKLTLYLRQINHDDEMMMNLYKQSETANYSLDQFKSITTKL